MEFVLNLIFFLTYPIAVCCGWCKKGIRPSDRRFCCPDESKMCLINEKSSCPRTISVNTYGESRDSRLEAEDTRYVMNELKKSQESLQNPAVGTKKEAACKSEKCYTRKSYQKIEGSSETPEKKMIQEFLKERIVYRNFSEPFGGLVVPSGVTYSLRGYFLNAENSAYRFITPCPFKQYWLIEDTGKKALMPARIYPSSLFMRSFESAREVYESGEISLTPKGICLNVQHLD